MWTCFSAEERRGIIHMLAMITLVFAAIITLHGDFSWVRCRYREGIFSGMFIRDSMGDVLKLFSYLVLAAGVLSMPRPVPAPVPHVPGEYFYSLCLFALLGMMVILISGGSLVTVYLGLELLVSVHLRPGGL